MRKNIINILVATVFISLIVQANIFITAFISETIQKSHEQKNEQKYYDANEAYKMPALPKIKEIEVPIIE